MHYFKIALLFVAMTLGAFMFVYAGADDSPGGQLLGLIIFLLGFVFLLKTIFVKNKIKK